MRWCWFVFSDTCDLLYRIPCDINFTSIALIDIVMQLLIALLSFCYQQEREHYEYVVAEGKILHNLTGNHLDTTNGLPGAKWIFVMSTSKRLYAGEVSGKHYYINALMMIILQIGFPLLTQKFCYSYAFQKKKGIFHHSSFLAGGATLAAGRLVVKDGILKVSICYIVLLSLDCICLTLKLCRDLNAGVIYSQLYETLVMSMELKNTFCSTLIYI